MDFLHKSITGRARTRSEQATLSKENQKRKRELEDMRTARETALTNIKEKGLASRKQLELTQAKELAKPEAAYWRAKKIEAEFTNYMDRAKAKKMGFALPGEERGGIAGSSESWKEEQSPSGTARITDEATGKVYEDSSMADNWKSSGEVSRSRASQVTSSTINDDWKQLPLPKKGSRIEWPLAYLKKAKEKNIEKLSDIWADSPGKKLYDWLSTDIALP